MSKRFPDNWKNGRGKKKDEKRANKSERQKIYNEQNDVLNSIVQDNSG